MPTELKPGSDEQISHLGSFAHEQIVVGRETFRAVDKFGEPARRQRGDAPFPVRQRLLNFSQSGSSSWKEKSSGIRVHHPWLGEFLERARA